MSGKPKPRPEGSVKPYTLADGTVRYLARVPWTPDPRTGKRRTKSEAHDTRKAAQAAVRRLLTERDKGIMVDPSRMTVADLVGRWLDEEATLTVRPTTLHDYRASIETHVLPRLGHKRAQALTPADISAFRAQLLAETGPRSAELAFLRVRQVLKWALAMELIARDPAATIVMPQKAAPEKRALTHAESRRFLDAAKDDYFAPIWQVFLSTGVRRGEALGLRWQDVNLDKGELSVRQQVTKKGKPATPRIVAYTKTNASHRTMTIDEPLVIALESHKRAQTAIRKAARVWENNDLIFCTRHGLPHNPDNLYESLERICTVSGVGKVTPHELRHSHLSHCVLAGVPIIEVSKRAGHSKISVTHDLYSHLLPDYQGASVDAVMRALYSEDFPELPSLGS